MRSSIFIHGLVVAAGSQNPLPGLRVEAWDKDLLVDDFVGEAVTDGRGLFQLRLEANRFQELFFDREPDLFFRVYRDETMLCSTENSVLWNRTLTDKAVLIAVPVSSPRPLSPPPWPPGPPKPPEPPSIPPAPPQDEDPPAYHADPDAQPIVGVAIMSPVFGEGLLVEAFADADLTDRLGWTRADAKGRFEIAPSRAASEIWLRYSSCEDTGRSPRLQPHDATRKVRLLAYGNRLSRPAGTTRFQGEVSSASGKGVVAAPIVLLEVTLRRCQVLGRAMSGDAGSYLVRYNKDALWADKPDLRVVVFNRRGEPLVISATPAVNLPNGVAETEALYDKVHAALAAEGISRDSVAELEAEELSYVAERNGLSSKTLRAFVEAAKMQGELGVEHPALFALLESAGRLDVKAALDQAVRADVLSPSFVNRDKVERVAAQLKCATRKKLIDYDLGRGSLDTYLAIGVGDADQRAAVAEWLFDGLRGEALDGKLRETNLDSSRLKTVLELRDLIGLDAPLARTLVEPAGGGTSLRSAEALATWSLSEIKTAVKASRASEGEQPTDGQVARKARQIRRAAERRFPTTAFRAELARHSRQPWARQLQAYVEVASDFDYAHARPKASAGDGEAPPTPAALLHYKNIERIAGTHAAVGALMNAGVTSSRVAAMMGKPEFVARFLDAFEGDTEAAGKAHDTANQTFAALNYGASFLPVRGRPSLCACSKCKSILSPAAYLFELLLFMGRYSDKDATEGGVAPVALLEHFSARRPEVTRVRLSCPNTNIEVPHIDLVNELLEDWIVGPGHSITNGLEDGQCMPLSHETQGNNEERRAAPQNPPSQRLREMLQDPSVPWSLPYDYAHDLSQSAKRRLLDDAKDVALEAWRNAVARGDSQADTTAALAREALGLTQGQRDLIVGNTTAAVVDVWGFAVEEQVVEDAVELTALKQISGRTLDEIERLLDARFVHGEQPEGEPVTLEPDDPCASSDPPRLVGPEAPLREVLLRAHRFERMRRSLGWDTRLLDEAIAWLGGSLGEPELRWLGVLGLLAAKLRVDEQELLGLFRTPSAEAAPTMRARTVPSPFEALFGTNALTLVPIDATLKDVDQTRAVEAQIAAAAGIEPATVHRAFAGGFVPGFDGPADLLALTGSAQAAAFRAAVGGAYRVFRWARSLRISEEAFVSLVSLAGLAPIATAASTPAPADALQDAITLVSLAEESRHWPLDTTELAYLSGSGDAGARAHSPTASQIGAWLSELREALQTARESQRALPPDPRAALAALIGALLEDAVDERAGQQERNALAEKIARRMQWSAFFPGLADQASETLGDHALGWIDLSTVTIPSFATVLADSTDDLRGSDFEGPLPQWLLTTFPELDRDATTWTNLDALHATLRQAVSERLEDPTADLDANFRLAVDAFVDNNSIALDAAGRDALGQRLLRDAATTVEQVLQERLRVAAEAWREALQVALRRQKAARALTAWASKVGRSTEPLAAMLLGELPNPKAPGAMMASAFIAPDGGSANDLTLSVVTAQYWQVDGSVSAADLASSDGLQTAQEIEEATLSFDWSKRAPLPGLKNKRFAARLRVAVPVGRFFEGGSAVDLVIETDGQAWVAVEEGDGSTTVLLDDDAGGDLQRLRATIGALDTSDPSALVTLEIRYVASASVSARGLRIQRIEADGQPSEFAWGILADATVQLHRAALALRGTKLAPEQWRILAHNAVPERAIDLAKLATGVPFATLRELLSLHSLASRSRSPRAHLTLIAWVAGAAVPRQELLVGLNLETTELSGALQLLGVADWESEAPVLEPHVTYARLESVLTLVDRASALNLPVVALERWNEATPEELYQWVIAALRSRVQKDEWWSLLAEVHDPVREHLRDAQLDYLLSRPPAPTMVTPAGLSSREAISDFLCVDTLMTPCMPTSRIQFAYSAVQRYIRAALADFVPGPAAGQLEAFTREWEWRRHYRLAEAQQRILIHTENWIEPEIRPTKTPAFERFEQALQSGPLTMQLADRAMKGYLTDLVEVARLEPIAIVNHEEVDHDRPLAFRDTDLPGLHVFARTRTHPQRIYYRRRLPEPDRRWTPWERVDAEMQGTHYVALVAFGKLRLLCADFAPARRQRGGGCEADNSSNATATPVGQALLTDYEVSLSWVEREHGSWGPVHRGDALPFPVTAGAGPDATTLWAHRPTDALPAIEGSDVFAVEKVRVEVTFGTQAPRSGSKLHVYLGSDAGLNPIGETTNVDKRGSVEAPDATSIDIEQIERVRLRWEPVGYYEFPKEWGDDCNVARIQVIVERNGAANLTSNVTFGRMKPRDDANDDWYQGIFGVPFWLKSTGDFEDSYMVFDGQLDRRLTQSSLQPERSDFVMQYEVNPDTIDFRSSLRVEAAPNGADSFYLDLHTVDSFIDLRMRGRYKLAPGVDKPGADQHWPTDWVVGDEFCYPSRLGGAPIRRLQVFSDGTVTHAGAPALSAGQHLGVRAVGQQFVAAGGSGGYDPEFGFHLNATQEIYAGPQPVAVTVHEYELVVRRDQDVSHMSSPKLLDERHASASEPARTFLIERHPGVHAPPEKPQKEPEPTPTFLQPGPWMPGWTDTHATGTSDTSVVSFNQDSSRVDLRRFPATVRPEVELVERLGGYEDLVAASGTDPAAALGYRDVWTFTAFWHPQAVAFRRLLEARGLPRLLRTENQELSSHADIPLEVPRGSGLSPQPLVDYFEDQYNPTRFVSSPYPRGVVDFTITGVYSEYNWEVFFDAILHLAKRFDADAQFANSEEFYKLLLDTSKAVRSSKWSQPELFKTAPIRHALKIENGDLAVILDDNFASALADQFARIHLNPYQPHIIARGWPSVYARALQIHYAQHLLSWGDHEFRLAYLADDRTRLEIASETYDRAARVLGPFEDYLSATDTQGLPCFAALTVDGELPPGVLDVLEPYLPAKTMGHSSLLESGAWGAQAYFCVPENDRLNELRATVASRLLDLRACRDIEGVRRALSLYGRRIDPALLVRATAEGLDIDILLGRISGARPTMYFHALWSRAVQACERARALEDAWIGAQERADSEAMTLLQNEHEIAVLEMGLDTSQQRLHDARLFKQALQRTVESAEVRHEYYSSRKRVSGLETAEGTAIEEASSEDSKAADDARAASDWAWVPTVQVLAEVGTSLQPGSPPAGPALGPYFRAGISVSYEAGGKTGTQVYSASGESHRSLAARARAESALVGRAANFERRFEDWQLQATLAKKDVQRGERDLASADIRIVVAELECDLQRRRIENARALRTFLKGKLTSEQFQHARTAQLQPLRYQQYRLAYDLAAQCRAALVRELGLEDDGIMPDQWDDSRHGIGAAHALLIELEQLQKTYVEVDQREKHKRIRYSLVDRDPLAFLQLLQQGETLCSVTETDYDGDGAGDWFRRARNVTVDIPAVTGPYSNINARVTLLRSEVRAKRFVGNDPADYSRNGAEDGRFRDDIVAGDYIETSSGVQDDGRAGVSGDPERVGPFVLNGAIATYRLELRPELNHYDRQAVADVILTKTYSSRPGGEQAQTLAIRARREKLAARPQPVMVPLHTVFTDEWHRFVEALQGDDGAELTLTFDQSLVPGRLLPVAEVAQTHIYFATAEDLELVEGTSVGATSKPPSLQPLPRDPRPPLPIQRVALREALTLGEKRSIGFERADIPPARAWLICWVRGVRPA